MPDSLFTAIREALADPHQDDERLFLQVRDYPLATATDEERALIADYLAMPEPTDA